MSGFNLPPGVGVHDIPGNERTPRPRPAPHAPSVDELQRLAALCSAAEWTNLLRSHRFIGAACRDLAEVESVMSQSLGRKISLSAASVSNPGDEQL